MAQNAHDTKLPISSAPVMAGTVNGASAKDTKGQGSPSGDLGRAQPGTAGDVSGGAITGFGAGKPDRSTINGSNGSNPGFGSPSGHLAATPSNPSDSQITGFSGNGIKAGKI
jgi:hypothetical protein